MKKSYVKYLTNATTSADATTNTGASIANETVRFVDGESISANIIIEERPVIFVFSDIFETTWDKIKTIRSSN